MDLLSIPDVEKPGISVTIDLFGNHFPPIYKITGIFGALQSEGNVHSNQLEHIFKMGVGKEIQYKSAEGHLKKVSCSEKDGKRTITLSFNKWEQENKDGDPIIHPADSITAFEELLKKRYKILHG
jgi:hypothetical protein